MKKLLTYAFTFCIIISISCIACLYLLFSQSIRLDEAQSIWIATKPLIDILKFTSEDVHVPLYNFLLHFWIQVLGTPITHVRLLSFLFFILTIPMLYTLARESSNRSTAFLTISLFALSPFVIWYANEARMYTLFIYVTTVNEVYFLRFIKSKGEKSQTAYILSAIVGFYTHYFFIFVVLSQLIFVWGRIWIQMYRYALPKNSFRQIIQLPLRVTWSQATAFLFFIPWIAYVILQGAASNTQPLIPPPTSYNILQTLIYFVFGFQPTSVLTFFVALWPLLVTLIFFVFTLRKKIQASHIEYFVIASFLPIILVFVASYIRPIFLSRYLILVIPTLYFLIAWILLNYTQKIFSYLTIGFLGIMFSFLLYQNLSNNTPVKENYEGVSAYLKKHVTARDIIAVSAPFTIYPIEYSYSGAARIITIPPWDRYTQGAIPSFSKQNLVKQMNSLKSQYAKVYVVLSYDQGYEKDIRNYLDTHFQLLEKDTFSPSLQLRVYKLRYDVPEKFTSQPLSPR